MKELVQPGALVEAHEQPMPRGPRLGAALTRRAHVLLALGYLFTFVPPILSPVGDLLALAILGASALWGMLRLAWRLRR